MKFEVRNYNDKADVIRAINDREGHFTVEINPVHGTRSLNQNSALHASMRTLKDALNDGGFDMKVVLKEGVAIDWTEENVKKYLFQPIMKAMTGKTSSAELNKIELSEVWDTLQRHLGEKVGVYVPLVKGQ